MQQNKISELPFPNNSKNIFDKDDKLSGWGRGIPTPIYFVHFVGFLDEIEKLDGPPFGPSAPSPFKKPQISHLSPYKGAENQ